LGATQAGAGFDSGLNTQISGSPSFEVHNFERKIPSRRRLGVPIPEKAVDTLIPEEFSMTSAERPEKTT
jgi:hypothetical protein